jgi:SAM-dependent methyltransferase
MRRILQELPWRVRDLLPDIRERTWSTDIPLPPPSLRRRVSRSSSRREFLEVGLTGYAAIRRAFEETGSPSETYPRWLDFGCGPGRLSRHLARFDAVGELWGIDTDTQAIDWARAHLAGNYRLTAATPPVDLPSGFFDVIVALSVFTHLNEASQLSWLQELHRLLRPGGRLIATLHSPELTFTRPDLTAFQHEELQERGFLFAAGGGPFNDDSAFHTKEYLLRTWGELLGMLRFVDHGLAGYQDLYVWVKW